MECNWNYVDDIIKEEYKAAQNNDYCTHKKLVAEHIENGVILPFRRDHEGITAGGGVAYPDGSYAEKSAQRIVGAEMNHGYTYDKDNCKKIDKAVVWFGGFHPHWGHFITEMVSRCWYLAQERECISGIYVAYIRKNDSCQQQINGSYLEFLELLGVDRTHIIEVEEPTRFQEIILPEVSCRAGVFYTKEFVQIFDTIREAVNLTIPAYDKIYFTRLKSKNLRGTQLGEKSIERLFRKNGYHVIAPEHFSLREQIYYMKQCKEMVVISGTLPHNIIFAEKGIRITVINRVIGVNTYQSLINQARDAKITYIDAHLSLFPVFAEGPFLLYVNDNMKNYLRDRQMKYKQNVDNPIGIHIKLAWYFFCYLDNMKRAGIEQWGLNKKFGPYVMDTYGFYRDKIAYYDLKKVKLLRKCFYILARMFE